MSMRRWRVEGVDKVTGESKAEIVNARTEGDARSWGFDQNWYVSKIVDLGPAVNRASPMPVALSERDIVRMANARGVTPDEVRKSLAEQVQVGVIALDRQTLQSLIVTIALGLVIGNILTAFTVFFFFMVLFAWTSGLRDGGLP